MSLDVHPVATELAHQRHGAGSMNTATMTFMLFFEDPKVASWVRERTRAVVDKHPSRVVIFDATKAEGEQHAERSLTRGEWVEVGVRHSTPDELAAALSTLALPEAPIVLAWIGVGMAHDARFVRLAEMAHTVICSTSVIKTDASALQDLAEFVESSPHISVQDIAYLRLWSWQQLIAEFFDESSFVNELVRLREVKITAGSDAEMYYLLGWLASRLAWTPCARDQLCNRSGEIIRFSTIHEGPPRRLSSVVLKSANVTFSAQVYPDDPDAVSLEVTSTNSHKKRCAPLHTLDIASLVERAFLSKRRDEVFVETLALAKHIIEARIA